MCKKYLSPSEHSSLGAGASGPVLLPSPPRGPSLQPGLSQVLWDRAGVSQVDHFGWTLPPCAADPQELQVSLKVFSESLHAGPFQHLNDLFERNFWEFFFFLIELQYILMIKSS